MYVWLYVHTFRVLLLVSSQKGGHWKRGSRCLSRPGADYPWKGKTGTCPFHWNLWKIIIILWGVFTLPQNIPLRYSKNPHHPLPDGWARFLTHSDPQFWKHYTPLPPRFSLQKSPPCTWISRFFQVIRLKLNLYSKEYMYHTITPRRCYCVIYKALCGTQFKQARKYK